MEGQTQTLSVHGFAAKLALILIYQTNSCCLLTVSTWTVTRTIILYSDFPTPPSQRLCY